MLPQKVISSASNTYAKKRKRLGIRDCLWRLNMVIFTYSNILLSVNMINRRMCVCRCGHERPLGLFEVLTRNRQSAVGRLERIPRTQAQPDRMFTIPPRQQLSSTTLVGDTNMESYTLHKHIQTNKAFFNRDTHIQYTEMFALLKLFFFLF